MLGKLWTLLGNYYFQLEFKICKCTSAQFDLRCILFNTKEEKLGFSFYLRIVNYLEVTLDAYVTTLILMLSGDNQVQIFWMIFRIC